MKKTLFMLIVSLFLSFSFAYSQWATNGNDIYNTNSDNVGIGTKSPAEKLHVVGNIKLGYTDGGANFGIEWFSSAWGNGFGHKIYNTDPGEQTDLRIAARHNSGTWTDMVAFTSTGKVGIGMMNPEFILDVNSTGRFTAPLNTNSNVIIQGGGGVYNAYWITGANNTLKIGGAGATEPSIGMINITYDGKMGIGRNPEFNFDVASSIARFGAASNTNSNVIIQGGAGVGYNAWWLTGTSGTLKIGGAGSTEPSLGAINIDYAGNVGIGITSNASYKLAVNGTASITTAIIGTGVLSTPAGYNMYVSGGILTEKIKAALATSANWSDYVFDKKYQLRPLAEVEAFIKINKHLPDVPSGDELVKDGGIDMNDMFARQMEKIEELTLYIIEQNKQIELLKSRLAQVEKK